MNKNCQISVININVDHGAGTPIYSIVRERNNSMFIYNSNDGLFTVYLITNKTNNKRYIGIHKEEPNEDLRKYMGSGRDLIEAIKNEGVDNFDKIILARFDTREEMVAMEVELVTEDIADSAEYYNKQTGGTHQIHSKATLEKMSESKKGENNHFYNKKHSEKSLEKMRGENNPMYGRTGEKHPRHGKTHSEEAKQKQSEAMKGEKHPRAKLADIYCYDTDRLIAKGIIIREWCRENPYHQGTLSVTTRADRTIPSSKTNPHHHKGVYAQYAA